MSHFVRSQRRSVSGVAFRTAFDGTPLRFVPDYEHQLILLGKSDIVKLLSHPAKFKIGRRCRFAYTQMPLRLHADATSLTRRCRFAYLQIRSLRLQKNSVYQR